jgi:hopene-associated glycosyltransferase HpnB
MLTALALLSLLAWIYLLFFHHGFWRADQRLPYAAAELSAWPSVVALVPARNEAPSIGACVGALAAQDYKGAFRVVVIDDASTDGTGDIARAHSCEVITAPPIEAGWTGKLGALNAGMTHVGDSTEFIWLTDADIVHPPEALSQLMAKAEMDRRDLVSLMVKLHCASFWERLLIPAFVFFFQMLYPFPGANNDRSRIAAAAGGCVLVRRAALQRAGGIAAIRGAVIDDCELARIVKRAGGRTWLGLADGSRSLRAAEELAPLWTMVRRTAFTQLGHSFLMLLGTVLGLALIFLVPPLTVLLAPWHTQGLATLAGFLAWGSMAFAYAPTLRDYGRNPWQGLLLPLAATMYGAMTVDSGVAHWRHRGAQWKGRYYGPSAASRNLSESS